MKRYTQFSGSKKKLEIKNKWKLKLLKDEWDKWKTNQSLNCLRKKKDKIYKMWISEWKKA